MPTVTLSILAQGGSVSINSQLSVTVDHPNPYEVTLPAGKDVTAWVKTDSDTAACNLPAGHGYSNGNFDVYWIVSGITYCRYGVPGTISTNALSLDGGSGTAFPASATTGIVVTKQVTVNTAIDGDACSLLVLSTENTGSVTAPCHVDMLDGSSATVGQFLVPGKGALPYYIAGGAVSYTHLRAHETN